jgi:hypothetical protein
MGAPVPGNAGIFALWKAERHCPDKVGGYERICASGAGDEGLGLGTAVRNVPGARQIRLAASSPSSSRTAAAVQSGRYPLPRQSRLVGYAVDRLGRPPRMLFAQPIAGGVYIAQAAVPGWFHCFFIFPPPVRLGNAVRAAPARRDARLAGRPIAPRGNCLGGLEVAEGAPFGMCRDWVGLSRRGRSP